MRFLKFLKDNNIFREATGNEQIDYIESLKDIKIIYLHEQGSVSFTITALYHKGYDYDVKYIKKVLDFIENNEDILEDLFNELEYLKKEYNL